MLYFKKKRVGGIRMDVMGRKRKSLEDKSTTLMVKLDNKMIFNLCDKFRIEYDRDAEILETGLKNDITVEIVKILKEYVK